MAGYSDAENLADAESPGAADAGDPSVPQAGAGPVAGLRFAGAVGLLACCDIVVSVPSAQFAITGSAARPDPPP